MIAGTVGMEFNFSKREPISSLAFEPSDAKAGALLPPRVESQFSLVMSLIAATTSAAAS
jgi:hypothetical protein